MGDPQFDDIIKRKLEEQQYEQASDWELLAQRLDEEVITDDNVDDSFDAKVREELQDLEDYSKQSESWTILQSQLDTIQTRHRSVMVTKAIELTVLLIIYMGYSQLYHPIDTIINRLSPPILMADAVEHQKAQKEIAYSLIGDAPILGLGTVAAISRDPLVVATLPKVAAHARLQSLNHAKAQKVPQITLPLTAPLTIIAKRPSPLLDVTLPLIEPMQSVSASRRFVAVRASLNTDIISTPADEVYKGVNSYQHYADGYTIGADLIWRKNRFDLRAGISYSKQEYDPRPVSETNTQDVAQAIVKTKRIEDISFAVISLPIGLDYRVVSKGPLSLTMRGGVSANAVAVARYEIKEEEQSSQRRVSRSKEINSNKQIDSNFQLSNKPFNPGIAEGGAVMDNLYLTLMAGAGIEYRPSASIAIQVSADYHHNLAARLGPNQDKIHTLGLQLALLKSI